MADPVLTRIFVYGSLLSGEPNHGLLRSARYVGVASTLARFELRSLGGFPGLVRQGTCAVVGEVYEVDAATLLALDRLEGHPDYYRRERIKLTDGSGAEAYLLPAQRSAGCPVIPSGSWRQHRAAVPRAQQLDGVMEEIYRCFSGYSLPPVPRVCACCVDASDHRVLTTSPLRTLTTAQLAPYAWKAMTTWGDADEFRYYLPRLLELLGRGQGWSGLAGEVLLGKLSYGDWRSWPAHESEVIERFFRLLWSLSLDDPSSLALSAPELLCGLSAVFDDLTPFLKAWDAHPSEAATEQLVELQNVFGETLQAGDPESLGFWQNPGAAQVAAWLQSPAVQARLALDRM